MASSRSRRPRQSPLVSILIPTYNRAEYLEAAIESALAQTYSNFELIIHDDASTDNTSQILRPFRSHPRVRIIRTARNHGMIGGWNYLQAQANGEYLKFLASDDLLEPDCLTLLVRAALKHPQTALVTCQRRFINSEGQLIKLMRFAAQDTIVPGIEHARLILSALRENKIGEPTAVLYPRKLVELAGGYDPDFTQFADFEYWLRLLQFGDLVYLDQPLCSFRLHEGSSTSSVIREGKFIPEIFRLIAKYYHDPRFVSTFGLTASMEYAVRQSKTLDVLKNIKDLFVEGRITQARRYYRLLQREVSLDAMTRAIISYLLE